MAADESQSIALLGVGPRNPGPNPPKLQPLLLIELLIKPYIDPK